MYLLVGVCSFALTYYLKRTAQNNKWVDNRKEKGSYKSSTPTCGGLAIACSWFLGLFYLFFTNQIPKNLFYALLLGIPITLLGFLDDLYNLKQRFRLIIQMGTVLGGLLFLGGLQQLNLGIASYQNPFALNILAFIGMTWVINLYNFQDGIDGYAASEAIFLGLVGFILFGGSVFLLLAIACSGFLFWNWQRAKIYMGDTGSLLLGYSLSVLAIFYQNQGYSILNFVILFTAFWCDSTFTLIRDLWNREDIMKRHKRFTFHKLVTAGWSHQKVVISAMSLNLCAFFCLSNQTLKTHLFSLFITSIMLFIAAMLLADKLEKKKLQLENKKNASTIAQKNIPIKETNTDTYIPPEIPFLSKKTKTNQLNPKL